MRINPDNPAGGNNLPEREWIDMADLLQMFPRSKSTLYRWIRDGILVAYKPTGKPLFKKKEVEEGIAKHKVKQRKRKKP